MSYTICIVEQAIPHGDEDAWRHLHELLARRDQESELAPAGIFLQLIDRLSARFPCICDLPEDEEESGLWSDGPLKNNAEHSVTVLGMVYDKVDEGLPFVVQTANALGLTVFDEQTGKIHRPVQAASQAPGQQAHDPEHNGSYRVVIQGINTPHTMDEVVASLVTLFKRPEQEVRLLLDGRRSIVKKGIGKSEAGQYQQVLEQRGCRCTIEPETGSDAAPTPPQHQTGMPADTPPEEAYAQGKCYEEGKGIAADKERAVACYRIAAEQGHADAQARLGIAYLKGEGIGRDPAWAFSWLRKAAGQGNAEAQYWLGKVAEQPAPLQAIDWYRKAAEQGHVEAQIRLTLMYSLQGAPYEDQTQASAWYLRVAQQGYAGAQYMVAMRYLQGLGVTHDREQALGWLKQAAQQGHAGAQSQLDNILSSPATDAKSGKPFWKFW